VMNNLRLMASTTPGQSGSMTDALTTVISEIEQNVVTKIQEGFSGTQAAIGTTIDELSASTQTAVDHKSQADDDDDTYFNCIRDEKAKREKIEEDEAAMTQSRSNEDEPCQSQQDSAGFQASPQLTTFLCDISTHSNCIQQMTNYKSQVNGMVSGLKSDLSDKKGLYATAKGLCDAAVASTLAKSNAHDASIQAWQIKRGECQKGHEDLRIAQCSFGTELQRKCTKATAYTNLLAEVDQVGGGVHSQPDREQEWKTTQLTICMLTAVAEGGSIDADTLNDCDRDATSVGELDRRQTAFEGLMTAEKFTCSESTITFLGQVWNVPEGEAPPSSEYFASDFSPQVDLVEGSSAFSFCRGK